jgi:hypothetical protein
VQKPRAGTADRIARRHRDHFAASGRGIAAARLFDDRLIGCGRILPRLAKIAVVEFGSIRANARLVIARIFCVFRLKGKLRPQTQAAQ